MRCRAKTGSCRSTTIILRTVGKPFTSNARKSIARAIQEAERTEHQGILTLELKDGMVTWDWGYRNLFLSEYCLLTGDKAVLPAIREYTVSLAKAQSQYGTFGHGISRRTTGGQLHGSIPRYGPVNAAGLVANLAIVMGRKCGIEDPEIEPAIARGSQFFARRGGGRH